MATIAGSEDLTAEGNGEHFVDRVEQMIESPQKEQITQGNETTADTAVESKSVVQVNMGDSSLSNGEQNTCTGKVSDMSVESRHNDDGIFVDRSEIHLTLDSPNTCQKSEVKQVVSNSSQDLISESMAMQDTLFSPNGTSSHDYSSLHTVDHLDKKSEGDEMDASEKVNLHTVNSTSQNGEMSLPLMELSNDNVVGNSAEMPRTAEQSVMASTVDTHILRLQALGDDIESLYSDHFMKTTFNIFQSPDREICTDVKDDGKLEHADGSGLFKMDDYSKYRSTETETVDNEQLVPLDQEKSPVTKIDIEAHILSQQTLGSELDIEKMKIEEEKRIQRQLKKQEQLLKESNNQVSQSQMFDSKETGSCELETENGIIPQTATDYRVDHSLIQQVEAAEMREGVTNLEMPNESFQKEKNIRYIDETPKQVEPLSLNSQKIVETTYIEEKLGMQEEPIEIRQEQNIEVEQLYQHLKQQETANIADQNVMNYTQAELDKMSDGNFSQLPQNITNEQRTATENLEQIEQDSNCHAIIQGQAEMKQIKSDAFPQYETSSSKNLEFSAPPQQQIEMKRKFKVPENSQEKLTALGAELIKEKSFKDAYYDSLNYTLTLQNCWFRKRDSVWELKVPVHPMEALQLTTQYREITDAKEIIEYLSKVIQYKGTSEIRPMSSVLRDLEIVEFATITSTRKTYVFQDCTIDLDLTDFGYRVGEIEVIVSSEERISEALRIIDDVAEKLGFELPCMY